MTIRRSLSLCSDTSLFSVAVHEIGHALGLDHSDVRGSLMWPWYVYHVEDGFVLPEDDRLGIQSIYGRSLPRQNEALPSIPPSRGPFQIHVQSSFWMLIRDKAPKTLQHWYEMFVLCTPPPPKRYITARVIQPSLVSLPQCNDTV